LKGLAQRSCSDSYNSKYLREAIKSRKKAVAESWKALCKAELRRESSIMPQLKRNARICLRNLAVAYTYQKDKSTGVKQRFAYIQAKSLFRQALSVTRSDAELHFELGKTYHKWEKHDRAAKEYNSAIQIDPTNPEFWAYLALAYAKQKNKESALCACEKVLNCASGASNEALDETARAYKELGKLDQSRRVGSMKTFIREVEEDRKKDNAETLLNKLKQYDHEGQEWECAQVAVALGRCYLGSSQPEDAEKYFQMAIDKFKGKHPEEIKRSGLQGLLVTPLLDQEKHREAMQAVEEALRVDPLNSFERITLGDFYFALGDFEQARVAWEEALFLEPDNPGIHFSIGLCYQKRAADQRKTTGRDKALQQAVKYLNQSLDLYDESNLKGKGQAHCKLGSVYVDLSEYEKAIYHLRIAKILRFAPLTTTLELGRAYLKNRSYDKCVEQFDQLINGTQEAKKKLIAKGEPIKKIPNMIIVPESISLGVLLVLACLHQASSYAERDVNLEEALELAKHAEDYIDKLDDGTAKVQCQAAHADCKGWILYKQDRIDEAIEYLERAVSLAAAAGAYLRLALACERKFQKCEDKEKCQSLIMQAQAYCQHARQLDFNKEYSKRVNDLLLRLREKKRR
jgi:tetratricopeptide (TPR) repeat protein